MRPPPVGCRPHAAKAAVTCATRGFSVTLIAALGRAETPAMVGDDAPGSTVISHLPQARSNPAPRRGVGGDE